MTFVLADKLTRLLFEDESDLRVKFGVKYSRVVVAILACAIDSRFIFIGAASSNDKKSSTSSTITFSLFSTTCDDAEAAAKEEGFVVFLALLVRLKKDGDELSQSNLGFGAALVLDSLLLSLASCITSSCLTVV